MSDTVLLVAGLGLVFAALSVTVVAMVGPAGKQGGVARSLAQVEQMTGLAGPRAEVAFGDRVISPSLQRMAALGRRLSPSGVAARIQRHLDLGGNPAGWTVEKVLAYKGMGLLVGAGAGILIGLGGLWTLLLWGGVLGAAGFFLPDLLTWNKGLKRQETIQKTLPDALDMLTVSVEAGLGFDAALHQVARNTEGPLSGEFFRVLQEMQIGKSRSAAFRSMTARTTVTDLRNFVAALVQADKLGIPIANVLREQAKEMRIKRRQRAEEKAQKIPIKILFPMIFFIFPALFIVILGPAVISMIAAFSN
jgi:tight adherence protein C